VRGYIQSPLVLRGLEGGLSYSYWRYDSDRDVHLVTPTLGYWVREDLGVEARMTIAIARFPDVVGSQTEVVNSYGLRGLWFARPTFTLGLDYALGSQLDLPPTLSQLVVLRSHFFTAFVDQKLPHGFGVRPLFAVEYRTNTQTDRSLVYLSPEVGAYLRW
jgi:hypothetical protein